MAAKNGNTSYLVNRRQWLFHSGALLACKHTLRGLVFSWPLYLLSTAGLALPGKFARVFLLLLIPAVGVSGWILTKGLREDYRAAAQGRLLKLGDIRRALFGEGR